MAKLPDMERLLARVFASCKASGRNANRSHFTVYLKEHRILLADKSITYVTVGKDAYLLEVPESLGGSVPQDYELSSSKKGFFRCWTPNIKKSLTELSQAESERESSPKSILQRLIGQLCEHHTKWRQLVSATAELDVLISLAQRPNETNALCFLVFIVSDTIFKSKIGNTQIRFFPPAGAC
ncbi:hypothetical protein ACLB2K_068829 [Fragaria x ananassa]